MTEGQEKSGQTVVRCMEVTKRFGQFEALRKVSAEVRAGEVVCIVGPSGGGKSTFLRTLNGLESIDGGEIHVLDVHLPANQSTV